VAIIVGGRIINQGTLHDLISEKVLFTEVTVSGLAPAELAGLGESLSVHGGKVLLKVYDEDRVGRILDLVRDKKAKIESLIPRTETLEDIFVDMVRRT